jgi:hypothetical protein
MNTNIFNVVITNTQILGFCDYLNMRLVSKEFLNFMKSVKFTNSLNSVNFNITYLDYVVFKQKSLVDITDLRIAERYIQIFGFRDISSYKTLYGIYHTHEMLILYLRYGLHDKLQDDIGLIKHVMHNYHNAVTYILENRIIVIDNELVSKLIASDCVSTILCNSKLCSKIVKYLDREQIQAAIKYINTSIHKSYMLGSYDVFISALQ